MGGVVSLVLRGEPVAKWGRGDIDEQRAPTPTNAHARAGLDFAALRPPSVALRPPRDACLSLNFLLLLLQDACPVTKDTQPSLWRQPHLDSLPKGTVCPGPLRALSAPQH